MGAEESPETVTVPLSGNRGFRLLMGGQLASSLGTSAAAIALPLVLLDLTGSTAAAGSVSAMAMLITLLLGLVAGVFADRWPRRGTLVVAALVAAVVWAVSAFVLHIGASSFGILVAAAGVSALAMTFFQPAQNGAVRHLVPRAQLSQAIAIDQARETTASLLGAPIGGALLVLGPAVAIAADSAGFLIAAACIAVIGTSLGPNRAAGQAAEKGRAITGYLRGLLRDAGAGLKHLWSTPAIRTCFLAAAVLNLPFIGIQVGLVLGLRAAGTPVYLIGLVETFSGLGAIVGATLVGPMNRRISLGRQIAITSWAIATGGLLIALTFPHIWFVLPACFLNTLFVPALNGTLMGHVFGSAPEDLAGRLGAAAQIASGLLIPLAPLAAGILIQAASGQIALVTFAGLLVAIAAALSATPSIRRLTT
ncbi:MFS transporter [Microbacterium protaetiae]|nr:MFS transporter [Microbacterium protaetiae]